MMQKIPNPDMVVVTHWSEFHGAVVAQMMSLMNAREHFSRLSEAQKSAYSIRQSELDDYDETYPKIGA